MEIKIIETNLDTIVPACVMEAITESDEIKRQRAEEARIAAIESNILKSGIIRKINKTLREKGYIRLVLAREKNYESVDNTYWRMDSRYQHENNIIKNVRNEELFDYLVDSYRKAGYKIGGHGYYSPSYWKDEERIIYAMADCDNCEA